MKEEKAINPETAMPDGQYLMVVQAPEIFITMNPEKDKLLVNSTQIGGEVIAIPLEPMQNGQILTLHLPDVLIDKVSGGKAIYYKGVAAFVRAEIEKSLKDSRQAEAGNDGGESQGENPEGDAVSKGGDTPQPDKPGQPAH